MGEWSEFYELTFSLNWLIEVDAITRVRLVHLSTEPAVRDAGQRARRGPAQSSVLAADQRAPTASPREIAKDCGMLYETYGWSDG